MSATPFRSNSPAEAKAEVTTRAARQIIDQEVAKREAKTKKLREAREKRHAEEAEAAAAEVTATSAPRASRKSGKR